MWCIPSWEAKGTMPCIPSYQSFLIPSSILTIGYGHMKDNSTETQQKPKKSVAKNQKNQNKCKRE